MNKHLNNEEQNENRLHKEEATNRRGSIKEGNAEGEYRWCTFYTRMNMEF
jgi:hypothetical protein